jgi:hypothetical protein
MKLSFIILSLLVLAIAAGLAEDTGSSVDQYNGQPVGPALSPDDANGYVDSVVKNWVASKLPNSNSKIGPEDLIKLVTSIKRLGMADLAAAYGQTAPDVLYRVDAAINPQDEIKRAVLEKALSLTATTSDIDALLGLYDSRPLILDVLNDHPDWDADPRVSNFLTTHLDQIQDAYKASDLAPTRLLSLAARNTSPTVQGKLDSLIADATTNDSNYSNSHLYLNLITVYAQVPCPVIAKHLPDIFAILATHAKSSPSDVYNEVSVRDVFLQLQWALQFGSAWKGNMTSASAALFSDQKAKDAILKLAAAAEDSGFNGIASTSVLVPAAACGDKPSLKKLAEICHDSNGAISSMAKKYLITINCQSAGDKLPQVIDHIDTATYDPATCTWAIPKDNEVGAGTTSTP